MRILYLHQYFKTPEEGGAIRSYYLASAMVKAGHQVILLTSHNRKAYEVKDVEGIEVHYLPVFYSNNLNTPGRAKAFLQFLWQARRLVAKLAPCDFCYVSSTPLTIGLMALYVRRQFLVPYIFEVRDLWPAAPVQLGFIKNPLLKKLLHRLEHMLYNKARAVVALSPGIARGVKQRTPSAKIHLIPNMADCIFFKPAPINRALSRQMGTTGCFVISYLGAAGFTNHLEYFLEAAHACQKHGLAVKFLIVAEGSKLEDLKKEATRKGLKNVIFNLYGGKEQVKEWLSISHAVYTSFGPYPILQTNSPNKFFDGLAAGKLSIVNTRGWLKELVEENHCGFYTQAEKPEDFVKQLKPFLEDRHLLQVYQQNARRLAEESFSRDTLSRRVVRLIEETTGQV